MRAAALLGVLTGLATGNVHADPCAPVVRSVADYVEEKVPAPAVVQGTVTEVVARQEGMSVALTIHVRPARWFKGPAQDSVQVRGRIADPTGPCHGVFNFTAKAGEQWLFFGQMMDGHLTPDSRLSIRTPEGRIPEAIAEQLK